MNCQHEAREYDGKVCGESFWKCTNCGDVLQMYEENEGL